MLAVLSILGGFVLLLGGGEGLVRGAVGLARRFGLSELLIGLTVVAFGTSAPELFVSVQAALNGMPDLAVGNVVGSNIANIALILGAACLVKPVVVDRFDIRPDAYMLLAASALLVALGFTGGIVRLVAGAMVVTLVVHLVVSYRRERTAAKPESPDWHEEEAEEIETTWGVWTSVALVGGGLVALVFGTDLLIGGAVEIARLLNVPDAVVGLTVVAVGTSLPELATSVVAARKGHADVAVGNVLGSNLFNILLILGVTSLVSPVSINAGMARVDMPVMFALTALAVAVLMLRGRLGRLWGAGLTVGYLVYVVALYFAR